MEKTAEGTQWIKDMLKEGKTNERLENIKKAFHGPNQRMWDMYVLRHAEGKIFEEIGEAYGFSKQRAEQILSKVDEIILKLL